MVEEKLEEDNKFRRSIFLVMTSYNLTTLQVWDTTYSADSVEWCPLAPYHHIFVCGTYQLVQNASETQMNTEELCVGDETWSKSTQVKLGCLFLLVVDSSLCVRNLQTLELNAVLDTKWCRKRIDGKVLLAVATAKGEVLVYELLENADQPEETELRYFLKLFTKVKLLEEEEILALSLDWSVSNCDNGTTSISITVSDSHGGVSLLKLMNSALILDNRWKVHGYEAWISSFDYWNSSVIYSGGDDNKLLVLDSRVGVDNPVFINKTHEMGVTSIHCNEAKEYSIVSGSYDEKIRFWDTRSLKKPLSSTTLLGGIWRVKWDPHNFDNVLAACMYGGFCIVNAKNYVTPDVVATYKHNGLVYGSDWCCSSDSTIRALITNGSFEDFSESSVLSLIATCSFYDHSMCVSLVEKINTLSDHTKPS